MARSFTEWLDAADEHKQRLDYAIAEDNQKDILYYRGKYLFDLKQAYKLNNTGVIPAGICGKASPTNLANEIRAELQRHQAHIDNALQTNKRESNITKHTLSSELGLKIRRLATRVSQVNFASGTATKANIARDSAGLAKTAIKAPIMIAAKVASAFGPLAITIIGLPITLLASGIAFVADAGKEKPTGGPYNDTVVHQLSDALKDAVKSLSKTTYKSVGKI